MGRSLATTRAEGPITCPRPIREVEVDGSIWALVSWTRIWGRHDADVGWRRGTAWERKDWVALTVLAASVVFGALLVRSDVLRLGVRQGLLFLLVFVAVGALVVPLVRHAPLPVLHFAQPITLVLGGIGVAILLEPPARYVAAAAAVLGTVQFVLRIRLSRRLALSRAEVAAEGTHTQADEETADEGDGPTWRRTE